jgi:hypothetical protein
VPILQRPQLAATLAAAGNGSGQFGAVRQEDHRCRCYLGQGFDDGENAVDACCRYHFLRVNPFLPGLRLMVAATSAGWRPGRRAPLSRKNSLYLPADAVGFGWQAFEPRLQVVRWPAGGWAKKSPVR